MEIELLRNKFYSYGVSFNKFKNITPEQIKHIRKKIEEFINEFKEKKISYTTLSPQYIFYENVLHYLLNPNINQTFKTFDEKILFLVLATDPNCETFRTYLSINGITKELDTDISNWKTYVRKKIGFFDKNLLNYEKYFVLKYNLVTDVKVDYTNLIINSGKNINSFDDISSNRYKEILDILTLWKDIAGKDLDYKTYSFNIFYSSLPIQEKIILLIRATDPELKLLQIYNDECTIERIKKRCINEFNFYSKYIFKLEQLYHNKFENDIEIDTWQKKKRKEK